MLCRRPSPSPTSLSSALCFHIETAQWFNHYTTTGRKAFEREPPLRANVPEWRLGQHEAVLPSVVLPSPCCFLVCLFSVLSSFSAFRSLCQLCLALALLFGAFLLSWCGLILKPPGRR